MNKMIWMVVLAATLSACARSKCPGATDDTDEASGGCGLQPEPVMASAAPAPVEQG